MKIVHKQGAALIYLFIKPDVEPTPGTLPQIVASPNGTVKLTWYNSTIMTVENAQTLIKALEYAVEVAQNGAK